MTMLRRRGDRRARCPASRPRPLSLVVGRRARIQRKPDLAGNHVHRAGQRLDPAHGGDDLRQSWPRSARSRARIRRRRPARRGAIPSAPCRRDRPCRQLDAEAVAAVDRGDDARRQAARLRAPGPARCAARRRRGGPPRRRAPAAIAPDRSPRPRSASRIVIPSASTRSSTAASKVPASARLPSSVDAKRTPSSSAKPTTSMAKGRRRLRPAVGATQSIAVTTPSMPS